MCSNIIMLVCLFISLTFYKIYLLGKNGKKGGIHFTEFQLPHIFHSLTESRIEKICWYSKVTCFFVHATTLRVSETRESKKFKVKNRKFKWNICDVKRAEWRRVRKVWWCRDGRFIEGFRVLERSRNKNRMNISFSLASSSFPIKLS